MKYVCKLLLLLLVLYASPRNASAGSGTGQEPISTKISISFNHERLDSCLLRIQQLTGIGFAFNPDDLRTYRTDIAKFRKSPLSEVLDHLLTATDIRYKPVGNLVVLYRMNGSSALPAVLPVRTGNTQEIITVALPGGNGLANNLADVDITGTVMDASGKPLAGVSVVVKGSHTGTTTDENGVFHLRVRDYNVTLVISMTGYAPQEIRATPGAIHVSLNARASSMDDVVVIGYQTQKRSDLTGSVVSVTSNDIKDLPVTNVEEALQGRMAGVQVIKPNGAPGSSADILIRGLSSLNQPSPLYIVDGVRSSGENFNVQDIATVDVLKDASAAAIYGAAAAGGVIIITTKKGASGKPVIHFNARNGTVHPEVLQLLGRDDFVSLQRLYNPNYLQGENVATLPNTNWTKALYGNGQDQNYDLSVTGGGANSNYMVSGFYNAQKGVYIDNSSYLSGARINSDYRISNAIKFGEQLYATVQSTNPTNANPPPNPPFRTIPVMPVYDSSGNFAKDPSGFQGGNPVGQELTYVVENRSVGLQANAYIEVKLPVWLTLRSTVSYSSSSNSSDNFQETYNFGAVANATNSLEKSSSWGETLLDNLILTFDHTFGKHAVTFLAGYEQQKSRGDGTDVTENNQAVQPNFSFFRTSNTQITVNDGNNYYDANGLIRSEFGRVNYNYAGKYFISGAIRRDGDFTHFGPGNQYGTFPSVSGGWRISEEPFFVGASRIVNQLKLRGSYGVLGNSSIPSYYFLSNYSVVGAQDFTDQGTRNIGYGFNQIANEDIKWESVYETNIGLDAFALNNKLYGTFEWYNKTTKNVLYSVPLPQSSGIGNNYETNVGSISNTGFEITLGYRDKIGPVGFDINANGAFNHNKVVSLNGTNSNPIQDGSNNTGGGYGVMNGYSLAITEPGQPFAQFYGYKATGIYKTQQQISSNPQFAGQTANLGDLIFQDANHSGALNDSDRVVIGNPNPKLVYGFNLRLTWNGFDADLLFDGVAGVQIFNGIKPYAQYLFSDGNTTSRIFKDSYLGNNSVTDQPRTGVFQTSGGVTSFVTDPNGNYTRPSSYYVEPGGYLKLKNLQIGYNLPAKLLQPLHVSNLRLYVMANNVFTITKYSGLDPELSGSVTARGIDYPNQYPHTRIFTGGITLGF